MRAKRRRVQARRFEVMDDQEERMLQQALANSMVETQRIAQVTVPEAADAERVGERC